MLRARLVPKLLLLAFLLPLVMVLEACVRPSIAGRELPSSPAAAEGPSASVTRALDEDPPLPGAPQAGWSGLVEPAGGEGHAAHTHGGHSGH